METNYAVHPGAILQESLTDINMSQRELSQKTGISTTIINELIKGKRSMNVGMAQKLEEQLGLPATFWMDVQAKFDLQSTKADALLQYGSKELQSAGYTANQIADRFICYNEESANNAEYQNDLTNLKMQKLLFFAQKEFIRNGKILFADPIEHWTYGPVIKSVYNRFRNNANTAIAEHPENTELSREDEKLLRKVFEKYNRYTASYLVTLTYKDKAWINTAPKEVITPQLIRENL